MTTFNTVIGIAALQRGEITLWNDWRRDGILPARPDLYGAALCGADLQGAKLQGAELQGADLWAAKLQGADLRGAELQGADLRGAELWGANLRDVDLQGAKLQGVDLWNAALCGADLQGAKLQGADLCGADLWAAKLQGADLRGAELRGANLRDTDLRGASGVIDLGVEGSRAFRRVVWFENGVPMFKAGCRDFTFAEARSYWGSPDYPDRERGDSYLRLIDFAEGEIKKMIEEGRR